MNDTRRFFRFSLLILFFACCAEAKAENEDHKIHGKLYVTSWYGNIVSIFDANYLNANGIAIVGVQDYNVNLSPDQSHAWVSNNGSGTVSVIDTSQDAIVKIIKTGNGPRHTFFSPDGKEAYVTNEFDNKITIIETSSYKILGYIQTDHMPNSGIVVNDHIFVTNFASGNVSVIDRKTHEPIATIMVGIGPMGIAAAQDGRYVYVACHNSNYIAVLDPKTLSIVNKIQTNPGPVEFAIDDEKNILITTDGISSIQKINPETNQIVATISIDHDAGTHGIVPVGSGKVFITNTGMDTIALVDTNQNKVLKQIKVPFAPNGLAFKKQPNPAEAVAH